MTDVSITELKNSIDKVGSLVHEVRKHADESAQNVKEDILNTIKADELKKELKEGLAEVAEMKAAMNAPKKEASEAESLEQKHVAAFDSFMRKGNEAEMIEIQKSLSEGIDSDGGYSVPAPLLALTNTRLFETSPMRQYANIVNISGDRYETVIDNAEAAASKVSEKGSRPETNTPTLGKKIIDAHEKYANPFATQTILDDSAFNLEQWLATKVADKIAREENQDFVSGTGNGEATGFTNSVVDRGALTVASSYSSSQVESFNSGSAGSFSADNLIQLIGKLKFEYRQNAIIAGSREAETDIALLKDGDNRYLFKYDDNGELKVRGIPFVVFNDMADPAADAYSIAVGDFRRAYTIVDRIGLRVLRDPFSNKPFVGFYSTKRTGGDVVNYEALKLLKLSA